KNRELCSEVESIERKLAASVPDSTLVDPLSARGLVAAVESLKPDEAIVDIYGYGSAEGGKYLAIISSGNICKRIELPSSMETKELLDAWMKKVEAIPAQKTDQNW